MDYRKIGFLEALRRFCERRGIWSNIRLQDSILRSFGHMWSAQHPSDPADPHRDWIREVAYKTLASDLLNVHRTNLLLEPSLPRPGNPAVNAALSAYNKSLLGDMMQKWEHQIQWEVIFHKVPRAPAPQLALPNWPLTHIACPEYPIRWVSRLGPCPNEGRLATLLSIPPLPDSNKYKSFAYCVRSQRAYDLVEKYRIKGEMSRIEKLVVLEKTYLF